MPEWNDFFTALAVAAGTAFAVLLAALQFGSSRWKGTALGQAAAVLALLELLVPLIGSLVALMPGERSWRVGFLVMGVVGLVGQVWHAATYLRHEKAAAVFDHRQVQWGLPVSTCVYLTMTAFASAPGHSSVYVVAALGVWLIFSGAGGAWLLLMPESPARAMPDA